MQTILGANGIVAVELAKELYNRYTKSIRLVSRNPKKVNNSDELFPADLLDALQTEKAIAGSEVVYLTVGLPNRTNIWVEQWPVIMRNVLEACIKHQAKLVFLDNTYMYGEVDGLIKENTPFRAAGPKGKVRGLITNMLLDEIKQGRIQAVIGRAPEFYGPGNTKSSTNTLVFWKIRKSRMIEVYLRDDTLRTLIYSPDVGRSLALLGNTSDVFGKTFHLPCDDNRLTSKDFIRLVGDIYGKQFEYTILSEKQVQEAALTNLEAGEILELLPRYATDFLFDSSKFKERFPEFKVTTYKEGITEVIKEISK